MAQYSNKQTVTQPEEVLVGTTLQVPISLWRALRDEATERRVSARQIWMEAMIEHQARRTKATPVGV